MLVRGSFLDSFVTITLLFALKLAELFIAGARLFCYVRLEDFASHLMTYYYMRSVSVSDKASGIIYQSKYWRGPSKELRIITTYLVHM